MSCLQCGVLVQYTALQPIKIRELYGELFCK